MPSQRQIQKIDNALGNMDPAPLRDLFFEQSLSQGQKREIFTKGLQKLLGQLYTGLSPSIDLYTRLIEETEDSRVNQIKQILNKFKNLDNLIYMTVMGCDQIVHYKVKDRNQNIFFIGETHSNPGNSIELILELSQKLDCPIDVFIEKDHTLRGASSIPTKQYQKSNCNRFLESPWKQCLTKGKIPKESQIQVNPVYYKNCIKAFRGKVKLWNIDIRGNSIFWFILEITQDEDNYTPALKKCMDHFFSCLFNFSLHREDPVRYDKEFKDSVIKVFQNYRPDGSEEIQGLVQNFFKKTNLKREKSHIQFAESVNRFPPGVVEYWKDIILSSQSHLAIPQLMDLNLVSRLFRILEQQSSGVVIAFIGVAHLRTIDPLLENTEIFEQNNMPVVEFKKWIQCNTEKTGNFLLENEKCKQKTQRMKIFERKEKQSQQQSQQKSQKENQKQQQKLWFDQDYPIGKWLRS